MIVSRRAIRGKAPLLAAAIALAAAVLGQAALGAAALQAAEPAAPQLRLNQIQVVGTHNSYHVRPPEKMLKAAMAIRKDAKEWDYTRQPLNEQLDHGVRSFELDMHLAADGWQVMHVPTFDAGTTVKTFGDALRVVKAWSDAHPRHVPISFLMELKEEGFALSKAYSRPEKADVERLDDDILAVFGRSRLLTPDDVRGRHDALPDALRAEGWPTLGETAGKVFFILHEAGPNRDAYLQGHPALQGRAMFVESEVGQPHAATLIRNDPTDPQSSSLAGQGYLIRTRADSQGQIDAARRSKALVGGAHLVYTDYPAGEIEEARAFTLPAGAVARVHPLTGPESLRGQAVVEPIP